MLAAAPGTGAWRGAADAVARSKAIIRMVTLPLAMLLSGRRYWLLLNVTRSLGL